MACAALGGSSPLPLPVLIGSGGGVGPGWLPERCERFPLPRGFQRGGWGRRGGRRGRACVRGVKVCGVCIPETQRKRGQRDG